MRLTIDERPYASAKPAVSTAGSYQPVSFWQETIDVRPNAPLQDDIRCDVAIVGGGFTALSNAYELKKASPELEVVILERGVVGHGASGRNGGFSMPLFGWDMLDTVRRLGDDAGKQTYELMYRAVDHLRDIIEREDIACDAEYTGYVLLSTCPSREKRLRKELELAHRLGFEHEWLEGASLDEHIHSDAFRSGIFDPRPFILNPAKLARGLKEIVERMGVRVYEQTSVSSLVESETVSLSCSDGKVQAKRVLLALNGYGGALGFKTNTILPLHTYIVLTEPLTEEQLSSTGWDRKRASLETARNFIHYFRLTVDNRIAFGGEDADLYFGGAFRDHDEAIYRRLEGKFRDFFPTLKTVQITHRWGGTLGVALDMFPMFGAAGQNERVFYASGYAGHGVSLANYAGLIMAPAILNSLGLDGAQPEAAPFFYNRKAVGVPLAPLRFLGMKLYRGALRLQDRITGA